MTHQKHRKKHAKKHGHKTSESYHGGFGALNGPSPYGRKGRGNSTDLRLG